MKRQHLAYVLSIGIVVVGIVLLTAGYRSAQTSLPRASSDVGLVDTLSEAQRKLLESQENMSKWLLGLSYTTLAGLLTLRVRNPRSLGAIGFLPLSACALLLVAMYAAFLFQDATVFVLSKGPLYHLHGPLMQIPLLAQFWCLVGAIVLLGFWLFKPHHRSPLVLLVILVAARASALPQNQNTRPANKAIARCVAEWRKSRLAGAADEMASIDTPASILFEHLTAQTSFKPTALSCDYYFSLLDRMRIESAVESARRRGAHAPDITLGEFIALLDTSLDSPGLAERDVIGRLVSMIQLWRSSSGLLVVQPTKTCDATKPCEVLVDGDVLGLVALTARLQTGQHTLEIIDASGKKIHSTTITIVDGQTKRVSATAQ